MTIEATQQATSNTPSRHIPGEAGVWIFIMGDMLIFALFFCVFAYYRTEQIELFTTSQATLNMHYGVLNTLLLLTSSWFVVTGLNAARNNLRVSACRLFILAIICGAAFSTIKILEYTEKSKQGFT